MDDRLFTADKRKSDELLRRTAHMKTVDDLLFEATMEAGMKRAVSSSNVTA